MEECLLDKRLFLSVSQSSKTVYGRKAGRGETREGRGTECRAFFLLRKRERT